jgi:thymidylate synthase
MSALPIPHPELQYLSLVSDLIENGDYRPDRTGTGTYAFHGRMMRYDLRGGIWPLLTTKRIPWKMVAGELFWFLRGETNIRSLLQDGITIWSEWPHAAYVKATGDALSVQEFEKRVLADADFAEKWGDLGPVYGSQWRKWQGPNGQVFDQVTDVIDQLKTNPYSRRALFHGWNVAEIGQMALPPCHLLYQFFVSSKGELGLTLYQRSADVGLGVPFNIASAALLVHMMARETGLKPGELVWFGHDVHLYANHVEPIREQLTRTPTPFPLVRFIEDKPFFEHTLADVEPVGYTPQKGIKMDVAV